MPDIDEGPTPDMDMLRVFFKRPIEACKWTHWTAKMVAYSEAYFPPYHEDLNHGASSRNRC